MQQAQTQLISKTEAVETTRQEFPMLGKRVNRKPFIYLDNADSSQAPGSLESLQKFYSAEYGKPEEDHILGREATERIKKVREKFAEFIGAPSEKNIVFTRGCTESINIVAGGFAKGILKKGDEVLITALEHHVNIVPWQMACERSGAVLNMMPLIDTGEVNIKPHK